MANRRGRRRTAVVFANVELASLGGHKYSDLTGDGITADDTPLANVTINLYRGGALVASDITNADGVYVFDGLMPGDYVVAEEVPAGWQATTATEYAVALAAGADVSTGLDFANVELASLGGHKYSDLTGDGITADDTPLAGVTIHLYEDLGTVGALDGADVLVADDATDADGQYGFTDLLPGDYLVQEEVPAGYAATTPTIYAVALAAGADVSTGLDFANRLLVPNIELTKFTNGEDANTEAEAPEIAPGDIVTWTYNVTNTGEVAFTSDEVVITDDAGTPGDPSDDFSTTSGDIVLIASSDVGSDGILSPGEVWVYEATGIAQDLFTLGSVTTFNFSGCSSLDGPNGNIRAFTVGSVSVNVSAFGRDGCGNWSTAYLGQYSGGLGVTDIADGDGTNNAHTVDDINSGNYVLFEFSDTVVVDSAFLGYVVNDSDLTVWIGSTTDPFNNHLTLSDAVLTSLGFTEVNLTNCCSTRWADFNAGQVAGNVLVIAAEGGDDASHDKFKIEKLKLQKADHSCYENYAVVTTGPGGPTDSDVSHYCNPGEVVQPNGSIGNYFFIDSNENGTQDAGDFGVNGITVYLLDASGNTLASTVTASDDSGNAGYYLFYNLDAGQYIVEFVVPEAVSFTTKDVGGDTLDSDANANGWTDVIVLASGEHRRDVDAGVNPYVTVKTVVYKVEDYFTCCQKACAGLIRGVTLVYNDTIEELFVEVVVSSYGGRVADGFTLVIDDGGCIGGADKFAIFYFDASGTGASGPVLNVFGYNGRFDASSFRDSNGWLWSYDPDRIATSADNSTGWVKDISVVNTCGKRTMSFTVDVTAINDHVPLRNVNWQGAEIGQRASFALDTYDKLYTRYNSAGYLTKWSYCYHGWMDAWRIRTQRVIVEEQVAIEEFFAEYGWEVTEFAGDSDGDPPTDANDTESDENWEGSVDVMFDLFGQQAA